MLAVVMRLVSTWARQFSETRLFLAPKLPELYRGTPLIRKFNPPRTTMEP